MSADSCKHHSFGMRINPKMDSFGIRGIRIYSLTHFETDLLWQDTSGERLPATFEMRFVYLNGSFSLFAYMQTLKKTAPASFGALIGIFKSFPVS